LRRRYVIACGTRLAAGSILADTDTGRQTQREAGRASVVCAGRISAHVCTRTQLAVTSAAPNKAPPPAAAAAAASRMRERCRELVGKQLPEAIGLHTAAS